MNELPTNVRVASWLGAKCLRHFCERKNIRNPDIRNFCEYIESITSSKNIPEWDNECGSLKINGLGDPIPEELAKVENLESLIQAVHEISASQIYGAHKPTRGVSLFEKGHQDIWD